jgi:ABC-type nickel/cobalt efflux system permease component RcnA
MTRLAPLSIVLGIFCWTAPLAAHPVPRGEHDRQIAVHLRPDWQKQEIVVLVNYRLEVDKLTVMLDDMAPFADRVERDKARDNTMGFFLEFSRIYAPILAANLIAKADGKPLVFTYLPPICRDADDEGKALGHLRCDFVFESRFPLTAGLPQSFTFREGNYELQTGQILLGADFQGAVPPPFPFANCGLYIARSTGSAIGVKEWQAPDAALQAKPVRDLAPGDYSKLREIALNFTVSALAGEKLPAAPAEQKNSQTPVSPGQTISPPDDPHESELSDLFLGSKQGTIGMLLVSALIGAAHALTPGHGKTLVAAYLVGQRGTTLDALILGLVTTATHTGVVLAIALGLQFTSDESRQQVANSLGFAMGLALICLGAWLLLQRLAGRADHFHAPGLGHHHHHEPPSAHTGQSSEAAPIGWWGLIVMGMTGGIVPCWDAVAMLVLAVGMNLFWLALPMLLAFSAGLASVLVLVGVLVVHARKMLDARWSTSRVVKLLPIASALFVLGMGFLVCYQDIHGGGR